MTSRRTFIYARVSTDEQAEEGHSIDAQLRLCREFCARKHWDVVAEYVDPGESATTVQRPKFQDMLRDARANKCDIIVVQKLDRFSRSLVDTLTTLAQLSRYDVSFCSASEDFDFTTPIGRVLLALLAAFAQYFIDNLRAETKKGLRERVLKGYTNGTLPFGYQRLPKEKGAGIPVLHSKNIRAFRHAVQMCLKGKNNREISDWLNANGFRTTGNRGSNLFIPDNVADMLHSRFYLGMVVYKEVWHQGKHEAAIDLDTWEKVQISLRQRSTHRDTSNHTVRIYPLRKLAYCSQCGHPLRGQPSNKGVRKYKDMESSKRRCRGPQTMDAVLIEAQIGLLLANTTIPEDWHSEIFNKVGAGQTAAQIEEQRRRLSAELSRARKLFIAGDLPEGEYAKEKTRIQLQLDKLQPVTHPEYERAAETLKTAGALWQKATDTQRMELARAVFDRIYIDNGILVAVEPRTLFHPLLTLAAKKTSPPIKIGGENGAERAYGSDGGLLLRRAQTIKSERFYLPRQIIVILPPGSHIISENEA